MEIEVRILDVDIHEIRRKIFEYNGVLVKKENQINKLFDFDDDRLYEIMVMLELELLRI